MKKTALLYTILLIGFLPLFAQNDWTLDQCISHAEKHNFNVSNQILLNKKNERDIEGAKWNRLPDLRLSASQNYNLGSSFNISTGVGQRESRSNNFSLSSSLILFNAFRKKYEIEIAILQGEKGNSEKEAIIREVTLNIINSYLEILFNKEVLKIAQEQLSISFNERDRLQSLYIKGLGGKLELLQIESALAIDQNEVESAKIKIASSLIRLKEFLGINNAKKFDISSIEELVNSKIDNLPLGEISNSSIDKHPVIVSLELESLISQKLIRIAKTDLYPLISFNYSLGTSYFHIQGSEDVIFDPSTDFFIENNFGTQFENNLINFLGFSISIPIFNRLQTERAISKSKIDYEITQEVIKNEKAKIRNRIDIITNDIKRAAIAKEAFKVSLEAQVEAFSIVSRNFKLGNTSSSDFLQSKNDLARIKSELLSRQFEYYLKGKYLQYLVGI